MTRPALVGIAVFATVVGLAGWQVGRSLQDSRAQAEEKAPKAASAPSSAAPEKKPENKNMSTDPQADTAKTEEKARRTNAEWKQVLTDMQFYVTRQKGTERAWSGEYVDTKTPGTYKCVCCGEPLFTSGEKFDSHCGWPSFYQPIGGLKDKRIAEHHDTTAGMVRTEVTCRKCGAHLGHVFDDSPQTPTGLRYCINSASLKLEPKKEGEQAATPAADETPAANPPAKPK
jgi:peptide-methionine (R)-S-oxide reductase